MSGGRPSRLNGGERLRDWCNQLLDWVAARSTIRVGPGLECRQTEGGLVISLIGGEIRKYPARIITSPGDAAPLLPSAALYTARAMPPHYDTIAITTPRAPDYGRPIKGDAVRVWPWPAETYCEIIVRPDPATPGANLVELAVPPERVNFGPCSPPAAAAAIAPRAPARITPVARPAAIDERWPDSLLGATA